MRIALFVHCYFPDHYFGTEAYTRSVARELAALGHDPVIVAATLIGEPQQKRFVERTLYEGVPVYRIDRNVRPNTKVRDTFYLPDLRSVHERLLRHIEPDVVHICHLINHSAALLDVTRALALPTFATFTDFFGVCFTNTLQTGSGDLCSGPNAVRSNCLSCGLARVRHENRLLALAGHPAVRPLVSSALVRYPRLGGGWRQDVEAMVERPDLLRRAYGSIIAALAPSSFLKDAYVNNGFDRPIELSRFGVEIDRSPKAAAGGDLRIGYIGQLSEHKGVHLLLKALSQVAAANLRVDIWGSETQDPAYARRLRRLADTRKVHFRGTFPVVDIAAVLGEIDVLVIPSIWYENSPLILLQALATHTPVVVSDVQGLTEFIEPGVSGFSFERADSSALAAVLRRFTEDPTLAARMSSRTRYERTSREMVEDLLQIYRRHTPAAAQ